jgi:hypothetical protein
MRAALRYAAQSGETEIEFRLRDALFFFWFYRGYWSEGRAWLADVLERSNDLGATDLRGRAMQFYRDEYERLICSVRDALGEAAFSAAWKEGRVLLMQEAVAYALNGIRSPS